LEIHIVPNGILVDEGTSYSTYIQARWDSPSGPEYIGRKQNISCEKSRRDVISVEITYVHLPSAVRYGIFNRNRLKNITFVKIHLEFL